MMELYANMIFTSVNLTNYTDILQRQPNFIECHDKENENFLSSVLVQNTSYSCHF